MKFINADAGESVYCFLNRVLNDAEFEGMTFRATHNDVTVNVYPQSCITDLCDKYDLTKKCMKLSVR